MEKKTRQQLIDEFLAQPIKVGDDVYIMGLGRQNKNAWGNITKVIKIEGDTLFYKQYDNSKELTPVNISDVKKYTDRIGKYPFSEKKDNIKNIEFTLESILSILGLIERKRDASFLINGIEVMECNFNPFIFDEADKKVYYQRPFVWSVKDCQLLIESIYQNISCGKILVRRRSIEELRLLAKKGERELSFADVIDGKQRLTAIVNFINGEYPDLYGNYYEDLSESAQRKFSDHKLFSYSELPEGSKDKDVVTQFLKLNFCGAPLSEEHINFVKSIKV